MYTHLRCAYAEENESLPGPRDRRERETMKGEEGVAEGAPRTAGKRGGRERRKKEEGRRKGRGDGEIGDLDAEKHGGAREYSETGRRLSIQSARGYDLLEQSR